MTTNDVLDYFGGMKQAARFLDIYPQAVYQWGERPPMSKQYELEVKTNGELKADVETNTKG